jgi:hypothetical protein
MPMPPEAPPIQPANHVVTEDTVGAEPTAARLTSDYARRSPGCCRPCTHPPLPISIPTSHRSLSDTVD